jgi:hypothetical protein
VDSAFLQIHDEIQLTEADTRKVIDESRLPVLLLAVFNVLVIISFQSIDDDII